MEILYLRFEHSLIGLKGVCSINSDKNAATCLTSPMTAWGGTGGLVSAWCDNLYQLFGKRDNATFRRRPAAR